MQANATDARRAMHALLDAATTIAKRAHTLDASERLAVRHALTAIDKAFVAAGAVAGLEAAMRFEGAR